MDALKMADTSGVTIGADGIAAIVQAHVAGASDAELTALVMRLHRNRTEKPLPRVPVPGHA